MIRKAAIRLCLSLALVTPAVRAADVPITDEARAHFSAGVSFLQDPDGARYDDAYREFKAAYAASPSWKILGNLGLAALKLERDGEAIEAYSRYLAEGGKEIDRDERAQIERDLKTLQASVVTFSLGFEPSGVMLTDQRLPVSGSPVVNRYGPLGASVKLGLHPGHHRFTVELEGYQKVEWEVDAAVKQPQSHSFTLERSVEPPPAPVATAVAPPPQPPPPPPEHSSGNGLRIASYVSLGVGVVGIGVGTAFAVKAHGKYSDANAFCPNFPCQLTEEQADQRQSLADDADSAKTVSLVGFIAGGVALATGVTLFVVSGHKGKSEQGLHVSPFIARDTAGLAGSF